MSHMTFTPKSEKEIAEDNLLPPGVYDFEVVEAENKISKSSGNPMIELKIHVFHGDGSARIVNDYLMPSLMYKLRHAADACRVLDKYESGALDASDFLGKTGKCKVKIDKDKTGQYADKNAIQDYVKRENMVDGSTPVPPKTLPSDLNDSIPF